jgi:TfoX/Sxy family transcriptional regulator of competence genes
MKKWKPAPERWVTAFAAASKGLGEPRKMFGYSAAFANGNMFAGLHEAGLVMRLPGTQRETFLRLDGARRFEPIPGRVMREYVVAPDALAEESTALRAWLTKAFRYASSLPVKPARDAASKARAGTRTRRA